MTDRQPDRFVTLSEAMLLLGVKRSSFYRKLKEIPGYPRPIKEPDGGTKVSVNEIIAYQDACLASRN
jgi:predicted DNA-binding transcriptional regulator AlpA